MKLSYFKHLRKTKTTQQPIQLSVQKPSQQPTQKPRISNIPEKVKECIINQDTDGLVELIKVDNVYVRNLLIENMVFAASTGHFKPLYFIMLLSFTHARDDEIWAQIDRMKHKDRLRAIKMIEHMRWPKIPERYLEIYNDPPPPYEP